MRNKRSMFGVGIGLVGVIAATAGIAFHRGPVLAPGEGGDGGAGGAGGGGGGGGGADELTKLREEVARLQNHSATVLTEKKQLGDRLKNFEAMLAEIGGEDGIKKLSEQRKKLANDELGRLLADGKHDEWFDRRTATMRADAERRQREYEDRLKSVEAERDKFRTKLVTKTIQTAVVSAASAAGVVDTAIEDVMLAAGAAFGVDENYNVGMKDGEGNFVLGKDGKTPIGPSEWLDDMRKKKPHWFPPDKNAGARGGNGGRGPGMPDTSKMSPAEYQAWRREETGSSGYVGDTRKK